MIASTNEKMKVYFSQTLKKYIGIEFTAVGNAFENKRNTEKFKRFSLTRLDVTFVRMRHVQSEC